MRNQVPLLCLFFVAAFSLTNCTKATVNNDPVIGIWSRSEIQDQPAGKTVLREEWIFNDAYLGRYHRYSGVQLEAKTDFRWEAESGVYTIEYPGLDKEADVVTIVNSPEGTLLEDMQGAVLAHRE